MNVSHPTVDPDSCAGSLNETRVCKRPVADTDSFPAVDMSDAGDEYLLDFDLPGLTREEIQISPDGDALFLVGKRLSPRTGGRTPGVERPVGAFARRLVLPPDSCSDAMYATLQEGVLTLHFPKNAPRKPREDSRTTRSDEPDHEYTHY